MHNILIICFWGVAGRSDFLCFRFFLKLSRTSALVCPLSSPRASRSFGYPDLHGVFLTTVFSPRPSSHIFLVQGFQITPLFALASSLALSVRPSRTPPISTWVACSHLYRRTLNDLLLTGQCNSFPLIPRLLRHSRLIREAAHKLNSNTLRRGDGRLAQRYVTVQQVLRRL